MDSLTTFQKLAILLVAYLLLTGGGSPGNSLIVMLYEGQHGELPDYAIGAMRELVKAGRDVRPVDDDVTNGLGETPAWLKPALEPGRRIMGEDQQRDALVVLSGPRVVKAIELPASKEAILEAVR